MSRFTLLLLRLSKLKSILTNFTYFLAFIRHGVAPGVEHKAILKLPLSTVIDIGANRGQFALAARVISKASVISFEPLPAAFSDFNRLFFSDPNVHIYNSAIGDQVGSSKLRISASDDSSSLLPISDNQIKHFPGTHEVSTINVNVAPIDTFLNPEDISSPSLLKVDVQGFEMQVLIGCSTLFTKFDYIYCECSYIELYTGQTLAHDVVNYLIGFDFRLTGVFNTSYDHDGNCIQSDLLFVKNSV